MGSKISNKKRRVEKAPTMAAKQEVIEIDDSSPSPVGKSRPIFCLKNREDIKKFEEHEDCFILDFDPYKNSDILRLPDTADSDLSVVAETGQVALRDYPHPRSTCAKFLFEKTAHDTHCELCFCYVCDIPAPCVKWTGTGGHCHAINNEAWNAEKKARRQSLKTV